MPKPNFFIVGAPKAGTTSLASYLGGHPQVFICQPKEPNFFARQFIIDKSRIRLKPYLRSEASYLKLFRDAKEEHKAVGEASTSYLRFPEALESIEQFNTEARIIVMIRNPIDLVQALHAQLLLEMRETERDFARAWSLQGRREHGEQLPNSRLFSDDLLYSNAAKLGEQLERLLEVFPPDQVKVILFDEFVDDTQKIYLEILDFLGIERDARFAFPKLNERRAHRLSQLAKSKRNLPVPIKLFVKRAKRRIGIESLGINDLLKRFNTTPAPRVQLEGAFLRELEHHFAGDIEKLERLLHHDLSHWTHVRPSGH